MVSLFPGPGSSSSRQLSVSRLMERRPAGSRGQFSGIISRDPVIKMIEDHCLTSVK